MFRKTALGLALGFALAGNVAALGLGEISLDSALNQPLKAEIMLLNTEGLAPEDLIVSIGTPEDYERAGIARPFFHTDIEFEVIRSGGGLKIVVLSEDAIVEPFVDFIVHARWPQGRLQRSYTLLLDLPVFSGTSPQPVSVVKPQGDQAAPTPTPDPQPSVSVINPNPVPRPVAEARPAATPTPAGSTRSYTVQNGDTLWGIGVELARNVGLQPQQAMVAIHESNPSAFINGDINMLRRGAVLRLPERSTMQSIPFAEAVDAIQDGLNRSASERQSFAERIPAEPVNAQPEPVDSSGEDRISAVQPAAPQLQGRLELAVDDVDNPLESDQFSSVSSGGDSLLTGSTTSGLGSDVLENEIAILQEELDVSRLENRDLQERLANVEAQLESVQRLLELQDREMAETQLLASQTNITETATTPSLNEASSSSGDSSWASAIRDNLLWIGLVIVAGLVALALFLRGRGRDDAAGQLQEETGFKNYGYAASSAAQPVAESKPATGPVGTSGNSEESSSDEDTESPEVANTVSATSSSFRASGRDLEDPDNLDTLLFGDSGGQISAAEQDEDAALGEEDFPSTENEASSEEEFSAEEDEEVVEEIEVPDYSAGLVGTKADEESGDQEEPLEFTLGDSDLQAEAEEIDVNAGHLESDSAESGNLDPEPGADEAEEDFSDSSTVAETFTEEAGESGEDEFDLYAESPRTAPDQETDAVNVEVEEQCETNLELAQAYLEMEDNEGAIELLKQVAIDGSPDQQARARELLVKNS